MAKNPPRHVIPNSKGGWSVRQTGASRAGKIFTTQADAIDYARVKARKEKTDLYVHGRDGSVREKNSFTRK